LGLHPLRIGTEKSQLVSQDEIFPLKTIAPGADTVRRFKNAPGRPFFSSFHEGFIFYNTLLSEMFDI